jgi:hypothetical protein
LTTRYSFWDQNDYFSIKKQVMCPVCIRDQRDCTIDCPSHCSCLKLFYGKCFLARWPASTTHARERLIDGWHFGDIMSPIQHIWATQHKPLCGPDLMSPWHYVAEVLSLIDSCPPLTSTCFPFFYLLYTFRFFSAIT